MTLKLPVDYQVGEQVWFHANAADRTAYGITDDYELCLISAAMAPDLTTGIPSTNRQLTILDRGPEEDSYIVPYIKHKNARDDEGDSYWITPEEYDAL